MDVMRHHDVSLKRTTSITQKRKKGTLLLRMLHPLRKHHPNLRLGLVWSDRLSFPTSINTLSTNFVGDESAPRVAGNNLRKKVRITTTQVKFWNDQARSLFPCFSIAGSDRSSCRSRTRLKILEKRKSKCHKRYKLLQLLSKLFNCRGMRRGMRRSFLRKRRKSGRGDISARLFWAAPPLAVHALLSCQRRLYPSLYNTPNCCRLHFSIHPQYQSWYMTELLPPIHAWTAPCWIQFQSTSAMSCNMCDLR